MKRFLFAAVAASALLVPTVTFAQVKAVYVPGAHPIVVLVRDKAPAPQQATLTPNEVIAVHTPMAAAQRAAARVNYAAVAHCERMIADARATLRQNF